MLEHLQSQRQRIKKNTQATTSKEQSPVSNSYRKIKRDKQQDIKIYKHELKSEQIKNAVTRYEGRNQKGQSLTINAPSRISNYSTLVETGNDNVSLVGISVKDIEQNYYRPTQHQSDQK